MMNTSLSQEIVLTKQLYSKNTQIERTQEETIKILQEKTIGFQEFMLSIAGLYCLGEQLNKGSKKYADRFGGSQGSAKRYSPIAQQLGFITLKKQYLRPATVELHPHFKGETKVTRFLREMHETFLRGGSKMAERYFKQSSIFKKEYQLNQEQFETSIETSIETAINNNIPNRFKNMDINIQEKEKEKEATQKNGYGVRYEKWQIEEKGKYRRMTPEEIEKMPREPFKQTLSKKEQTETAYFRQQRPGSIHSMANTLDMVCDRLRIPRVNDFCGLATSSPAITKVGENPTKGTQERHPASSFMDSLDQFKQQFGGR